ncbi:hypothetical protein B0H16DRAFT_1733709 [Mycena metata]|uniref:Alpha-type protein kinase domain-containing protein n=1 Tax=Mycena metata TaxID=1033252 RepID=A0AAD7HXL3_9AGAR|nr:hypothetical protein B0H16DRAFT_1733709 [Mycena metata]
MALRRSQRLNALIVPPPPAQALPGLSVIIPRRSPRLLKKQLVAHSGIGTKQSLRKPRSLKSPSRLKLPTALQPSANASNKRTVSKATSQYKDVDDLEFDVVPLDLQNYTHSGGALTMRSSTSADFTVWERMKSGSQMAIHLGWFCKRKKLTSIAIKKLCLSSDSPDRWISREDAIWLVFVRYAECLRQWKRFRERCRASAVVLPSITMVPTYLLRRKGSTSWIGQPWINGVPLSPEALSSDASNEAAFLAAFSHFTYQASDRARVYAEFQGK